jgi:hypothetical protein
MFRDEGAPQYLTRQRFGQTLPKLNVRGDLEGSEVLPTVLTQVLGGRRGAGTSDDPRLDDFALCGIRHPCDTDVGNGRVTGQRFFHLARPDLEAAGLDQVLLAIDDEQKLILIEIPQVAGVKPDASFAMRSKGVSSLVGVLPVRGHQLGRPQNDLPDFSCWQELLSGYAVHDRDLDVREGDTD